MLAWQVWDRENDAEQGRALHARPCSAHIATCSAPEEEQVAIGVDREHSERGEREDAARGQKVHPAARERVHRATIRRPNL
eukprot:6201287-Pleurochrysis_carterae.AAC.1